MAKEYIEREALLREFGEEPYVWHDDDAEEMQERNDWNTYTNIVKAAPAADVATVVRCRDCQWYHSELIGGEYCGHGGITMDENDFCSYGKRKLKEETK